MIPDRTPCPQGRFGWTLMKRLAAAVVILFAVTTGTFADASAQVAAGSFAAVPVFGATGLASAVFMGGSVDQLETVTLAVGASGVWVQAADGSFSILIAGGPSFLKDAFKSKSPKDFLGPTAVTLVRTQIATDGPKIDKGPAPRVVGLSPTSYENYKAIGLTPQILPRGDNTIRAYGSFTGSGRLDLFRAVSTYNVAQPASSATPSRFEFYAQQPNGSYVLNTAVMAQTNGCLHPRKAIVADFNSDGRPDVFVACHGYDASPFPGEKNKIVLSQSNGTYAVSDASNDVGFFHGASAADLNNDGKIDVVVVDSNDPDRALVLLNNGSGYFARETPSRLPTAIRNKGGYFSVELIDINEDRKLDLIFGGHEFELAPTTMFLNPGNGIFAAVDATIVPSVANEGVVLDFTVTGTGATRTLWLVRASGGDGTFYTSRVVQKISYPALVSSVVLNKRPAQWIPWLIPAVVNGESIVTSDNVADGVSIPQ